MQKYVFIFCILTTIFLGCRSTHKPVQAEKEPERQVEVPKVEDSKKDAQKNQEADQLVRIEEVAITTRERKVKNMPLDRLQIMSKSMTAGGEFMSARADILPPVLHNTEEYSKINDNVFLSPGTNPLSTFSIDVDAASYANVRRFLNSGRLPYKDAVRIEELINYFNYDYEDPKGEHPFSVMTEVSQAPWNPDHKLVHIGLQGKKLNYEEMKPSNLVFLVDVSGSMRSPNKLPLLKSAFKLLVKNLDDRDRIAIVAYAGAAGLVLPSTPAKERSTILSALDKLEAGGSTAGGAGIKLAYKVAKENLIEDGNNRVILATDGDFNVGVSSTSELVRTIEEKRNDGIFLTICGFGMGNYKDGRMESISNAGNGNYFYIDNIMEANKVFVKEMRATLFTIAKDVKIQIEFNPAKVQAYRLIGYENRMLKSEDFNDDKKDAGELGAGHTVTALYEIIPVGVKSDFIKSVDELKYQKGQITNQAGSDELMTVKLRYKRPKEDTSQLLSIVIKDKATKLAKSSNNFKFSAAVAEFGMLLRDSEFKGQASYEHALKLAKEGKGEDLEGYRSEFVQLVKKAALLALN
ncbi:VWA domain-containing protein [candidate division KSB1 bacterium]|nr:VWA domain-containing protein [candidate division KSB1 bacterium]TDI94108.1 MAG: VWA domain-containing protein [Caldithrix sp.]